ncbi:MAG: hypothetical protein DRQ58_03140 [Gammaproteobacteria bacterium]|nr:MAG: hypothetical protein DRQ58_03140 [Gammaproteobacteria bacterium]
MDKFLITPCLNFARNIWYGTRFALFVPTALWQFRFGFLQLCLLLTFSFFLSFTYDFVDTSPNNIFNIYGLTYQATLYLLFFISVAIIAQIEKDIASIVNIMIVFLAFVPAVWGIYLIIDWLAGKQTWFDSTDTRWAIFYFYLIWYLAIIFRCIRQYYHATVSRSFVLVTFYGLMNFVPLFQLPQQPLWYPDFSREIKITETRTQINIEDTFYRQNELLKKATDSLMPERAGKTDLYFLGLAGYADEDVFMNEAMLVKELFDDQFDTRERSLLLINNAKTVKDLPLANAHNLETAVLALAETMNPEEDILFLLMTSHGSEDHELSVAFSPLDMNDIGPEEIKTILDKAGIKWRVIVISACYSGGFIEPLFDENMLIITAAGKDRNSFGCENDRDYTYFGEALFGKHLQDDRNFSTAFYAAKKDIEAREMEESLEASMPQIRIGANIEKQLLLFTDRLD